MASVTKTTTKSGEPRYRVRYRDPSGMSREKSFKRKVDADRFARNVETDIDRGEWVDPTGARTSFVEWSEVWMKTKADRKPKTVEGYRSLLANQVLPRFGARSIGSIRPEEIAIWVADLRATGLSASRVRQAFNVLNGCLRMAVSFGRLARNPADNEAVKSTIPAPSSREMRFLDVGQLQGLAAAAPPEYKTLVMTLGLAGIRWGEAASLRRRRVDVLGRRLHIAESASEVHGKVVYGTPKSGRDRWVSIPAFLADDLDDHLRTIPADPDSLVFTTPSGGPLRNSNFSNRVWHPTVKRAALPTDLRIHDLRHTSASLMIAEGAPITLVQRQLGHSSVVTTQRYLHLYPSQAEELASRLHDRFKATRGVSVGSDTDRVVSIAR